MGCFFMDGCITRYAILEVMPFSSVLVVCGSPRGFALGFRCFLSDQVVIGRKHWAPLRPVPGRG